MKARAAIGGTVYALCPGLELGLRALEEEKRLWDHCKLVGPKVESMDGRFRTDATLAAQNDGWDWVRIRRRGLMLLCPGCVAKADELGRMSREPNAYPVLTVVLESEAAP